MYVVVRCYIVQYALFYRRLDFSSDSGFANEILENEPKYKLKVAHLLLSFAVDFYTI